MLIGLSSIAWDPKDDIYVAETAARLGVDFIDLTPSKYFEGTWNASSRTVNQIRKFWESHGFPIRALQALCYGTHGLNLLGDVSSRKRLVSHLKYVADIGVELGAEILVFGSPHNRRRGSLSQDTANSIALEVLQHIGDVVGRVGLTFCVEANSKKFGCDFLNSTEEVAKLVNGLNHPAIKINFDTGIVFESGSLIEDCFRICEPNIGHIHLSEINLDPIGPNGSKHSDVASTLSSHSVEAATIEILPQSGIDLRTWLPKCLEFTIDVYRKLE